MTVKCLVYRVWANGRKWEHFTAARFRSILGGRWDSIDLLTLCPYHSAWLSEKDQAWRSRVTMRWGGEESWVCSLYWLSLQPQGHISMHTLWGSSQLFVGLWHFFFIVHHIFIALTEGQCKWDMLTEKEKKSVWWKNPKIFSPICFKLRACPCSTTQNNVPAHPGLAWVVYRAGLQKRANLRDLKLSLPQKKPECLSNACFPQTVSVTKYYPL